MTAEKNREQTAPRIEKVEEKRTLNDKRQERVEGKKTQNGQRIEKVEEKRTPINQTPNAFNPRSGDSKTNADNKVNQMTLNDRESRGKEKR
ncbi:MAG: hypothetical protein ACYDAO_01635 [Thermoplasmataceae archaeon]